MVLQLPVKYSKGFTLIEMMVAMLIIMVSMIAFLTTISVTMRASLNNDLREVSTIVANQTGEALLALPMTDSELSRGVAHVRIQDDATQSSKGLPNTLQTVRGTQTPFTIQWQVISLSTVTNPDSVRVVVSVGYVSNNQTITKDTVLFKRKAI